MLKLIDPPEWLVDFAYWLMAVTGVSLAPLLKLWDRLARRHRLLPELVGIPGGSKRVEAEDIQGWTQLHVRQAPR